MEPAFPAQVMIVMGLVAWIDDDIATEDRIAACVHESKVSPPPPLPAALCCSTTTSTTSTVPSTSLPCSPALLGPLC